MARTLRKVETRKRHGFNEEESVRLKDEDRIRKELLNIASGGRPSPVRSQWSC